MRNVLISSQKIACLFAILAFCAFFAACSGSDDSNTSSSASTVSAPASEQSGASSESDNSAQSGASSENDNSAQSGASSENDNSAQSGASSDGASSANSAVPNAIRVEFDSDGGSDVDDQWVTEGGFADQPPVPTRSLPSLPAGLYQHQGALPGAYAFLGWYHVDHPWDFQNDTVNESITLTAKWSIPGYIDAVGSADLPAVFAHVNANAASGTAYTFLLGEDITAGHLALEAVYADLTLIGIGEERTIQYVGDPSKPLFLISDNNSSATDPAPPPQLTLGNNITLRGVQNGRWALVQTGAGKLVMLNGSKITGHTFDPSTPTEPYALGTVYLFEGVFIMEGGVITGNTNLLNTAEWAAAGVYVSEGTFVMNGGSVSGNRSWFTGVETLADLGLECYNYEDYGLVIGSAVLSGSAVIGSATLENDRAGQNSFIGIGAAYTGAVNTINLVESAAFWANKPIIRGVQGHILTAAEIGRFGLGNFHLGTATPISPGYVISTAAGTIGQLLSSSQGGGSPAFKPAKSTQTRGAARARQSRTR